MTHRERWQALQAHLAAARASADAGDQQHALVEVNAALALDPDFLAAQSLRDRIVKKSAPPTSTAAAPMNFNAATPAAASPPPAIAERAFPAREAPVQQARLAWWADADVAASKPAAAPAATPMAGLELPIGGWRAADRVTAARSIGDLELRITDGQTVTLAPALAPAVAAPAEALRQAPLVSAEGYARFEARAKRRRVDRRVEAARAAIQRRRLHEAAVALNEIIALDPNQPELTALTSEFDELRKAMASPRRGPWLSAAAVFAALVLGASWLHESSLLVSYPVTGTMTLISPPPKALVDESAIDGPAVATNGVEDVENAIDDAGPPIAPRPRPSRLETLPAVLVRTPVANERDNPAPSPPAPGPGPDIAIPAVGEPSPPAAAAAPAPPPPVPPPAAAPPLLRAAAAPVAAPATTPPPVPAVPTVDDESLVKQTLQRYRHAYEGLDARSAHAVWPGVDQAALARAFGGLTSQSITFDRCNVQLSGAFANATCRGTARYVPKIGNREPRVEPRVWNFALRKDGGEWKIDSARAER